MEHNILQNNAVDMYQTYYSELAAIPPVERSSCHTVNVYKEPAPRRPVRSLSWQAEGARLASAHADIDFLRKSRALQFSYIWDIGTNIIFGANKCRYNLLRFFFNNLCILKVSKLFLRYSIHLKNFNMKVVYIINTKFYISQDERNL